MVVVGLYFDMMAAGDDDVVSIHEAMWLDLFDLALESMKYLKFDFDPFWAAPWFRLASKCGLWVGALGVIPGEKGESLSGDRIRAKHGKRKDPNFDDNEDFESAEQSYTSLV